MKANTLLLVTILFILVAFAGYYLYSQSEKKAVVSDCAKQASGVDIQYYDSYYSACLGEKGYQR